MTISPIVAAAVPAGIAAIKLAQQVSENQPFRRLLGQISGGEDASIALGGPNSGDLPQFLQLVKDRLAAAGIDTSLRFEISSDADGKLRVSGNHPHQAEIEQVLRDDPDVVSTFHRLAATSQVAAAARRHQQFAEDYLNDPQAASSSLPKVPPPLTIVINGDKIEIA